MTSQPLPASLFQALVHFAPDCFLVVDSGGAIVFANAQAEMLFGYSREELIGSSIERLVPERFREGHTGLRGGYWHAPRARPMGSRLALKALRRGGSEFDVEISLAPVYRDEGMLVSVTVRDVSEQRQLEEDRRRLLATAEIERERNRIAGDLHDGVMQAMYGVGLSLTNVLLTAPHLSTEEQAALEETIRQLNTAIEDVRRYVQDLHPADFSGDLPGSLQTLLGLFAATSGIQSTFENGLGDGQSLDPTRAFQVYLLAREALSNVRRHADASTVTVALSDEGGAIALCVSDNGIGFDPTAAAPDGHFGLQNMRSRAEEAGGRLDIRSAPGEGTEVHVLLPVR
jgi:PAS domain S-box-containing protein